MAICDVRVQFYVIFTDYIGIYNSIKQGESKIAEWFEAEKVASDLTDALKGE